MEDTLKENGFWVTEGCRWRNDFTGGYFCLKITLELPEGDSHKWCNLTWVAQWALPEYYLPRRVSTISNQHTKPLKQISIHILDIQVDKCNFIQW